MQAVTDKKNLNIVKLLLDRGAEINAQANNCQTALMEDARSTSIEWEHEKPDITKLLLERGADVNATTKNGSTALMYAATNSYPLKRSFERMRLLLDNGAHVNAKNKQGKTALMLMLEPQMTGHSSYGPGSRFPRLRYCQGL